MEDYTYHLEKGNELILGPICWRSVPPLPPEGRPLRVHPGDGNRENPARIVFEGQEGDAILVSLIDMGGRMRMIVNDVKAKAP